MISGGLQDFQTNPLGGPLPSELLIYGAKYVPCIKGSGQWWRIISNMFVFGGVIQFGLSVVVILMLGYEIEQDYGPIRAGIVYLATGIMGTIFGAIWMPQWITAGGDIPLFGWFGLSFASVIKQWYSLNNKPRAISCCTCNIVLQLAVGLLPSVDNFGHLGAFIAGFFISMSLLPRPIKELNEELMDFEMLGSTSTSPMRSNTHSGVNPFSTFENVIR